MTTVRRWVSGLAIWLASLVLVADTAQADEWQGLADLLRAEDLELVGLRIATRGMGYADGATTTAKVILKSPKGVAQKPSHEIAESIRKAIAALAFKRLMQVDIELIGPARRAPSSPRMTTLGFSRLSKGGTEGITDVPRQELGGGSGSNPAWFSRVVFSRPHRQVTTEGDPKHSRVIEMLPWQASHWWCEGSTKPLRKDRDTRSVPIRVKALAALKPVPPPAAAAAAPLQYVSVWREERGPTEGKIASDPTWHALFVPITTGRPLKLAGFKTLAKALRDVAASLAGKSLATVAVIAHHAPRYPNGGAVLWYPLRKKSPRPTARPEKKPSRIVRFEVTLPKETTPPDKGSSWYGQIIWHRSIDFLLFQKKGIRRDNTTWQRTAPLRFLKAGKWRSQSWWAAGNALPVLDRKSIDYFKPRLVK